MFKEKDVVEEFEINDLVLVINADTIKNKIGELATILKIYDRTSNEYLIGFENGEEIIFDKSKLKKINKKLKVFL